MASPTVKDVTVTELLERLDPGQYNGVQSGVVDAVVAVTELGVCNSRHTLDTISMKDELATLWQNRPCIS